MTREEAYYEQIMLRCGFWDGYDAWLDEWLEREDPLSDIVLSLLDCRNDMKQTEHCLRLYCLERPFDEDAVHTRLRTEWRDGYQTGQMKMDDLMHRIFLFSQQLSEGWFQNRLLTLSDMYVLVEEGVVNDQKFERVLLNFLNTEEDFDTKEFFG